MTMTLSAFPIGSPFKGKLPTEEGEDWEIHRFGHWGRGWFEIILIRPGTETARIAQELADSLEAYPILDESDWSETEHAMAEQGWEDWQRGEVRMDLERLLRPIAPTAGEAVNDCEDSVIDEWFASWPQHQCQYYGSDGGYYYWDVENVTREQLAELTRMIRRKGGQDDE
jgi:hypothetical protein